MKTFHGTTFLALAIAGTIMTSVAARETSAQTTSVATEPVLRSADLFGDLKACEVAGVHEHLLARGTKTLIFMYVVSGTGLIRIGDMSAKAGPGDFIIIPKGARHAVIAKSAELRAVYFEDRT